MHVERVRFHVDAGFGAANHVRNHMTERMLGDLLGLELATADHVLRDRVVMRDLAQRVGFENVRATIADVDDTYPAVEMISQRQRRAHATQLRMLQRFLDDPIVGLMERCLKLLEGSLGFGFVRMEEPLERIERELLDRDDGQSARLFAGAVASHTVGDEKQMTALVSELRLFLRQARLPDAHGLSELGDQKLILVRRAHPAGVADAEGLHIQRGTSDLRIELAHRRHRIDLIVIANAQPLFMGVTLYRRSHLVTVQDSTPPERAAFHDAPAASSFLYLSSARG